MEATILEVYEALARASGDMLAAAQSGDWDALVIAERECAAGIARLQTLEASAQLSETAKRRKHHLIRKVLAEDAQIRSLTQPWLASLEAILYGNASQRKLQAMYE